MPELPDLEVICEFLSPRLAGVNITSVDMRRPLIVRNLLGGELADHLTGRRLASVGRRGKFLLLALEGDMTLVVNPMLAGRIRYGEPLAHHRARDALVLGLDNGRELRYHDAADMGKVYLARDPDQVPTFASLGPEATDPALTLDVFCERLRPHRGEIKGILSNQSFVAGIGNAYADEILWSAHLYPFRHRTDLDDEGITRLYEAMQSVLSEAIATLRERVGENIDVEVRDFLSVHGKAGQPCPRCSSAISEVRRERMATHFCRACQPGLMIDRRR
jgi:formamidopyrimidine-DNA glycosylase